MTSSTAVVGSGYMGGGIAQVLALSGRTVALADVDAATASASRQRLIAEAEDYARRGLFPVDAGTVIAQNVHAAASIEEAVAAAAFVEEAVPEILDLKRETLARISRACSSEAIIGSNTSTIQIEALADAVAGPHRFLGVHFSNPAPFIPGVEVIPHASTGPAVVDNVVALLAECGKTGVPIRDVPGFVLNRLQYALFGEASRLVEEGVATAEQVDLITRTTFGFRLPFFGPFAIADIAGLDVYQFCYQSLHAAYPERYSAPASLVDHVERGEKGVKSGRGYLTTPVDRSAELAGYRDEAYSALSRLLRELGDAPVEY